LSRAKKVLVTIFQTVRFRKKITIVKKSNRLKHHYNKVELVELDEESLIPL